MHITLVKKEFNRTPSEQSDLDVIKDCLYELSAENNADFNGDNGEEYLEEKAKNKGYENNLEYFFEYFTRYYDVPPIYHNSVKDNYLNFIRAMIFEMARGCSNWDYKIILDDREIVIALSIYWN